MALTCLVRQNCEHLSWPALAMQTYSLNPYSLTPYGLTHWLSSDENDRNIFDRKTVNTNRFLSRHNRARFTSTHRYSVMHREPFAFGSLLLSLALFQPVAAADRQGTLIFEDDFERNESQETKEEIGNGWGSNSKKRAAGNKQVDLRDGAMYIYLHPSADHAVSVTHPAEFRNGSVELRFMLQDKRDNLGLNFADLKYKKVHAGHLFVARVSTSAVELSDLKTGVMDLKTRELRLADRLTPDLQEKLKAKKKRFRNALQAGKWYTLVVDVQGDTLSVSIDGKEVGSFSSEGIAHPTKRMLRLAVPRAAVVDDVKIFSRSAAEQTKA